MSEDSSDLKFCSSWTAIQGSLVGILGVYGVHVGFGCEPALNNVNVTPAILHRQAMSFLCSHPSIAS